MIEIGRLRFTVPPEFARRAPRIAQLVGKALAQRAPGRDARVARLDVPRVVVDASSSDRAIAARIASAVHARIREERR